MVGLISGVDETEYREEVQMLSTWCTINNLILIPINGESVERVSVFRFLGSHIKEDLSGTSTEAAFPEITQEKQLN